MMPSQDTATYPTSGLPSTGIRQQYCLVANRPDGRVEFATSTTVGSSRQRSQGGLVHLVNGCRGDAAFGGDRVDRVLGDVEVYPTVGGEVWADIALVVSLNFITGQPVEERGDVIDGQLGLFGDREKGSLVGPHQRLQRRVVERDTSGVHGILALLDRRAAREK